ncbi:aminomethyl-transferring glycine dehydrogenase subunit GcvPA [Candidatus Endomicrobiellum agilis]|uniref:aminomethyl-transferring glycine dehydrogenase subunit GcvPA n=1 Tax=Candidatus Endomicrobiellum agilis TaxID=3238957 RepID=UPI00357C763E|nr:aminomethyl-transferring glycine dehydrogenase subunit GcvPA [Endomicrobium sp.]
MDYTSQNQKDKKKMLETIGIGGVDELFDVIPKDLRAEKLNVSGGKTEQELLNYFSRIASKNKVLASFRGGGIYDHYIPSLVGEVVGRSEFLTAYTPYQAEASQGTLQSIFEYQSLICALTGLDTSNASLYDGATATAEAALLALRASGKSKILIFQGLHPDYKQTLETYLENSQAEVVVLGGLENGGIEKDVLDKAVDGDTAAVIIQSPNYFGVIEDMPPLSAIVKSRNSLLIAVVNPLSLGVFQSPGEYNADIAVGEGQVLGSTMSVGGATFGFIAVKKALEWKMPGRIVGQTVDKDGNRGFVLTLQSREQHIRREKATSNICTSAALNALAGCVFLSGWGNDGFKNLAEVNISKARYAFNKIKSLEGFKAKFEDKVFFNEFVIETAKSVSKIQKTLLKNGFLGPLDLSSVNKNLKNCLLFCVTEQRTKAEIDRLVEILAKA